LSTPHFKERLRRQILERHGLVRAGQGHLESEPRPPPNSHKTLAMRLLEQQFKRPIEELLMEGSLEEVGKRLSIHFSTVSHWRERLGLR